MEKWTGTVFCFGVIELKKKQVYKKLKKIVYNKKLAMN